MIQSLKALKPVKTQDIQILPDAIGFGFVAISKTCLTGKAADAAKNKDTLKAAFPNMEVNSTDALTLEALIGPEMNRVEYVVTQMMREIDKKVFRMLAATKPGAARPFIFCRMDGLDAIGIEIGDLMYIGGDANASTLFTHEKDRVSTFDKAPAANLLAKCGIAAQWVAP